MNMMLAARQPTETRYWRRFVLERLHRLFALAIVVQLAQCLRGYLWPETFAVVYATLAVFGVTELLLSRVFFGRLALQLMAAVAATAAFTPFRWYGWPDSWRSGVEVRQFLAWHGQQLHPYVEIAAAATFLAHYLSAFGTTRSRAILIILLSVFLIATMDSFFPLDLWRNVAWTVLAGLGWLVVLHLRQLRERHYDSWNALAGRPFELAVPAVLVIGLLMLAGIFVPRAPVLLEDPYTYWMQMQDKAVPGLKGEGGILNKDLLPKVTLSGSSKSGYGRNDANIGGGFQFDYSPVMQVATSQKSYYRGETKAVYTGKGWTDRKGTDTVPVTPGSTELTAEPARAEGVETKAVTQTVTMMRKDKIPVLFAAGPVRKVTEIKGADGKLTWNPEEWELKFQRPARPESYTVVSEVLVLDEQKLRKADAHPDNASIDLQPYLQLPDSLPARVKDLAFQVTEGATNDYDRAKKLEHYLQTSYPYTNTPDVSRQKSKDVVDAFLFEIKEGYCDYYSSAFVVMARTLGLPARWVKGYATGYNQQATDATVRQVDGYLANSNGAGTYVVRNADAHSWAEVYFAGFGWVPFEPTAGFSLPQPVPDNSAPIPSAASVTPDPNPSAAPVSDGGLGWAAWTLIGLAGAALLAGGGWLLLRRRSLYDVWQRFRFRGTTPNQRIVREMERLLYFLHRRGLKRSRHDTLRETFADWCGKFVSLKTDFEALLRQFEAARYGGTGGEEFDYQQFVSAAAKIRKSL